MSIEIPACREAQAFDKEIKSKKNGPKVFFHFYSMERSMSVCSLSFSCYLLSVQRLLMILLSSIVAAEHRQRQDEWYSMIQLSKCTTGQFTDDGLANETSQADSFHSSRMMFSPGKLLATIEKNFSFQRRNMSPSIESVSEHFLRVQFVSIKSD